jgi:hypothetical protein
MSGQAPESREGPAPANPPAAVQPPLRGTDEGAPHISGDVHTHHPRVEFRFLEQLKHRNVIRIGILYLVVCWLILDPVHVVFHMLEVPPWANRRCYAAPCQFCRSSSLTGQFRSIAL